VGSPWSFPPPETGFQATVDQLEAARTERTKALVFVSPSNPTGAVYPPEATAAVGNWAAEHGIWVITDEIYDRLVYGDTVFTSLPAVAPEAASAPSSPAGSPRPTR
jgi:aspartate aminotransferase